MHHLILPGWQNSGPDHWQSLWETQIPAQRVIQHDWMRPLRGDWITRLEEHLLLIHEHSAQETRRLEAKNAYKNAYLPRAEHIQEEPIDESTNVPANQPSNDVLLIAHSLGCHLVAAWAALSKQTHHIKGALLVAPPDAQRGDFPVEMKSWRSPVLQKLPFPSICVVSCNDPFCDLQQGKNLATAWGSECVEIGDAGHINAESGLGDWPQGQQWLARLAA